MWNDTDFPLAYFITFRCYGTWLHGDKRGSTNRFRNRYGSRHLPPEETWLEINKNRLKRDPVLLNEKQRACVTKAIRETCRIREWNLYALNVRTNHIHLVVSAGSRTAGSMLNAFKANATREMRKSGLWLLKTSPWSDKGSNKNLWNDSSIVEVIDYVLYGQGDDIPKFD